MDVDAIHNLNGQQREMVTYGLVKENRSSSNETTELVRDLPSAIALAVVLGLITVATILGNLLVCITIGKIRKLQTYTNLLILSLAAADLLLGCVVLPFSTLNTVVLYWPLGAHFCNVFVSLDVMVCTVSILNLFVISLDRFYAVTSPYRYAQRMSKALVWTVIGAIWVFSLVMAFIPIHLGWNTNNGHIQNHAEPLVCLFESNKTYVLLVAIGTYFTPLTIMCIVYIRVYRIARRQAREINKLLLSTQVFDAKDSQKHSQMASEHKATITLASVILAFTLCWVPYFALFTARPFVKGGFNETLDLVVLWLGYCNSTINPVLYAFFNHDIRNGFAYILFKSKPISGGHEYHL